jgi:ketosteroid isomerase-like protein
MLVVCIAAAASAPALRAQSSARDSADVHATITKFLRAFENLDWEAFRGSFADDVTVFFPDPEPPQRFIGRPAVEAQFRKVFDGIRKDAPSGPPFMRLEPHELRIIMLGPSAALVSFELRNPQRIGRRTIILRREDGRWRIAHLHASNESTEELPAEAH